MAYNREAYDADRKTMRFRGNTGLVTEASLALKRQVLASRPVDEQEAIGAAFGRLMAWVQSNTPIPAAKQAAPVARNGQGSPPEQPETPAMPAEPDRELAGWADELAGRLKRHDARRGHYPKVRPVPA